MPCTRSILPMTPQTPATSDRLQRICIYEIVEAHPPPRVDLTRKLKHSLLPPRLCRLVSQARRKHVLFTGALFILAQLATSAMLVVDVPHGRILSVASFCLQVPLLVLSFSALCTDIVLELLKTFEFWFFTFANTASTIVMAMYLADTRTTAVVAAWLGVEYCICIDAALHGFRLMVVLLGVAILCQCFTLIVIALSIVPDVHQFKIANYGTKTVTSDDFLMNTITTVLFILGRSLFRRVMMLRHHQQQLKNGVVASRSIQLVRCVSYRCTVRLRQIPLVGRAAPVTAGPQGPVRFVQLDRTFDSHETLWCNRRLSLLRASKRLQLLIHAIGATGLGLTGLLFLILNYVRPYPVIARVGAVAAPVLTSVYCFICVSLYHPALLRQICLSVDFAFMIAQFFFAHLCAAYLFEWDDRTFILVASFCWVSFMLTVDAFTPVARDRIGFQLVFLVPLLLLSITAHVLITLEVTRTFSPWGLRDESMFRFTAFGHAFELHVKPAFFNRVWMLVFWELRMLWRMLKASRHDLVMIHGAVDLDVRLSRRRMAVSLPGSQVRIQPTATSTESTNPREYTPQTSCVKSIGS